MFCQQANPCSLFDKFWQPRPSPEDLSHVENITSVELVVIREKKDYGVLELRTNVDETTAKFMEGQAVFFKTVIDAVQKRKSLCAFHRC